MAVNTILKATNREAVCTVVGIHVAIAAVEVEVAGIGTTDRTTPIVAIATYIVEAAIAVVAVARHEP